MKIIFEAVDGMQFEDATECQEYEAELNSSFYTYNDSEGWSHSLDMTDADYFIAFNKFGAEIILKACEEQSNVVIPFFSSEIPNLEYPARFFWDHDKDMWVNFNEFEADYERHLSHFKRFG